MELAYVFLARTDRRPLGCHDNDAAYSGTVSRFIYTESKQHCVAFDTRDWGGSDPAYFRSAFMWHCVFTLNSEQTQSRFRAALNRLCKDALL